MNANLFPRLATAAAIALALGLGSAAAQEAQTSQLPNNATKPNAQMTAPSGSTANAPSQKSTNRLPANKATTPPQTGDMTAPSDKMTGAPSSMGNGSSATGSMAGGDSANNAESQPTPQNPETRATPYGADTAGAMAGGDTANNAKSQPTPQNPDTKPAPYGAGNGGTSAATKEPPTTGADERPTEQEPATTSHGSNVTPDASRSNTLENTPSGVAPKTEQGDAGQLPKPRGLLKISESDSKATPSSSASKPSSTAKHAARMSNAANSRQNTASSEDQRYREALRQCVKTQDASQRDACLDNAIDQFGKSG